MVLILPTILTRQMSNWNRYDGNGGLLSFLDNFTANNNCVKQGYIPNYSLKINKNNHRKWIVKMFQNNRKDHICDIIKNDRRIYIIIEFFLS